MAPFSPLDSVFFACFSGHPMGLSDTLPLGWGWPEMYLLLKTSIRNGCTLPPPFLTSFWSVYEIMAVVSIFTSHPKPVSIRSNPTHSNQNILMKSRLRSCQFTAQNLSNHLLSLLASATTSTIHLVKEVIASHHGWIFWHYTHYLSVAIELYDFLFSKPKSCF